MESINGEHKEVHWWNVPIVNAFLNSMLLISYLLYFVVYCSFDNHTEGWNVSFFFCICCELDNQIFYIHSIICMFSVQNIAYFCNIRYVKYNLISKLANSILISFLRGCTEFHARSSPLQWKFQYISFICSLVILNSMEFEDNFTQLILR